MALQSATVTEMGSTELADENQVLQVVDLKEVVLHMLDVSTRQTTLVTFVIRGFWNVFGPPVVRQRMYLCDGAFGSGTNNRTRRALGGGTHGWAYQHGTHIRCTVLLDSFWAIKL